MAETDDFEGILNLGTVFIPLELVVPEVNSLPCIDSWLFFQNILAVAIALLIADQVPEDHVVLGQGPRFVCEDVFDLPEVLVDGSIVGCGVPVVLLRVALLVSHQDRTLEEFHHFYRDHKGNGDEVGHQQPPGHRGYPVVGHRDELGDLLVTVFEDGVEEGTNEGDYYLPDEDFNYDLVHLSHELGLLGLELCRVEHQLGVRPGVAAHCNDLMDVFHEAPPEKQIVAVQRDLRLGLWLSYSSVELVELQGGRPDVKLIGIFVKLLIFGDIVGDVIEEGSLQFKISLSV